MKYFFTSISIIALFLLVPFHTAHAISQCGTIDSSNYIDCCTGSNPAGDATQCTNYTQNTGTTTTAATPSSCSTVTADNASTCCTNATTSTQVTACEMYYNNAGTPPPASPAPVTTAPVCSASNITDNQCYENNCTGQSGQDSASCGAYATAWNNKNDPSNPQCYSVGPNNSAQCCPAGSTSPICIAYSDYNSANPAKQTAAPVVPNSCNTVNSDNFSTCCANATTTTEVNACEAYYTNNPTAQQVGGSSPSSGSPSTAAVNASNVSYGTAPANTTAIQSCSNIKFNTILDIAIWAKCIIGVIIIPGIFTLAFVVFLWGVFKFIRSPEKKDKEDSKQFIYMGIIGLFVMVSVWGIVKILTTTFGIDSTVPTLQTDPLSISKASTK